jgi:osmotically-inducible protein OsmY
MSTASFTAARRRRAATPLILVSLALGVISVQPPPLHGQSLTDRTRVEDIQYALLHLPRYGVFDYLTFTYDKGAVVLGGYAYHASLPGDAERAVRQVRGIDTVSSTIKVLPMSSFDDEIRWQAFFAIYTNAFLSKYAPEGSPIWSTVESSFDPLADLAAFPGGRYPIHIIVDHGRIRLIGMVDNETDKAVATMAARGVSGTFGVENELLVDEP